MKESAALGGMILGLVLLALSFWWSASSAPPTDWTEEDAKAYVDEGVKLHDMSFQVKRNGPTGRNAPKTVSPEELDAQKKRFEEKKAELEGARNRNTRTVWIMRGLGVVMVMGGLFAHKLGTGG